MLHKFFQVVSEQPEKITFSFAHGAQEIFDNWSIDFHNSNLDHPTEWESLNAHFSKYTSLLPKLAMLFHIANSMEEKYSENSDLFSWNKVVWPCEIKLKSLHQAFGFLDFLKQHAERVYSVITKGDELAASALDSCGSSEADHRPPQERHPHQSFFVASISPERRRQSFQKAT